MFKAFSKYYRIGCNFGLLIFSERNLRIRNVTNAAAFSTFSTKFAAKTQRKNVLLNVKDEIKEVLKIGKLENPRKIPSESEKVKELHIKKIKTECRQNNKKQLQGLSITSPPKPTESSKNPTTDLSQSNLAPASNYCLNFRNLRIQNVTNAAAFSTFSTKFAAKTQRKNVLLNVKDEIKEVLKIGKLENPRKIQSESEKVKELHIKKIKTKCRRQSNKKQLQGLSITSPPQPTKSSKNPTTALSQSNLAPASNELSFDYHVRYFSPLLSFE
uniref:Uncharacterized protein n=1 Tax=Panagrolaimus sp. PS1159 TaxID=55785 RepID=A0AC35FC81_9BILA